MSLSIQSSFSLHRGHAPSETNKSEHPEGAHKKHGFPDEKGTNGGADKDLEQKFLKFMESIFANCQKPKGDDVSNDGDSGDSGGDGGDAGGTGKQSPNALAGDFFKKIGDLFGVAGKMMSDL